MPFASTVVRCDCPVRFDTRRGMCQFNCSYCSEGLNNRQLKDFESHKALEQFILGKRNDTTSWIDNDWKIPVHFGVLSEPFPYQDNQKRRSFKALLVLAQHYYPVIITTKSTLLNDNDDYNFVLSQTNSVLQVSMFCQSFSKDYEPQSPSFHNRLRMLYPLSRKVRRLIVRCQPYMIDYHNELLKMIKYYKSFGVYGVLVGGMVFATRQHNANYRVGNGWCYDSGVLYPYLQEIRDACHSNGLVFLTNEMEADVLTDSKTCCGCADLFDINKSNLNYMPIVFRDKMKVKGTAGIFKRDIRNSKLSPLSFKDVMMKIAYDEAGATGVVNETE
jgi:DNA repair photolyase